MRNIGIVTFCNANNYGAVLQAYGLSQYLNKENEVEFLNIKFNPKVETSQKEIMEKNTLSKKIIGKIKKMKFEEFRKNNLRISNQVIHGDKDSNDIQDKYDYYIVGSDQVWNTDITNKTKAFFLDFEKSKPKIAYAASYGRENINVTEKEWSKECLKDFKAVSVREKESAIYLNQELKIDSKVVCDPVFLLDKQEWIDKNNLRNKNKSYILVYYMESNSTLESIIANIRKKYDFPIIAIKGGIQGINGVKHIDGLGPKDFLDIVYNAKIVITNSFHALAFSIIFNKKAIVFEHSKWNLRIFNLLELTRNKEKLITLKDNINEKLLDEKTINGEKAYTELLPLIEESKKFLNEAIN